MHRKIRSTIFLGFLFLGSWNASFAQSSEKIYSLFLFSFAQNLKFPGEPANGEFVIGVIGSQAVIEELNKVALTKKIGTSKLVIKEFRPGQAQFDCHLLFYYEPKNSSVQELTQKIGKSQLVLITSKDGNAKDTGGIDLFLDGSGKPKFTINQKSMETKGIKISSSLLALGTVV